MRVNRLLPDGASPQRAVRNRRVGAEEVASRAIRACVALLGISPGLSWSPRPTVCGANAQNHCGRRTRPKQETLAIGTSQGQSDKTPQRQQQAPWRSTLRRVDAFAQPHAGTLPQAVFLSAHWNFIRLPAQQLKKSRQNQTPLRPLN